MSDAAFTRPFADRVRDFIPAWMARPIGFRFLLSMVLLADVGVQMLLEGLAAKFPGVGTPTALPYLGRSRGLIRGMSESDDSFAARLIQWIDRWRVAGGQRAIARAIQEYCTGAPQVRVVNRLGVMTTALAAGAGFVAQDVTWNWDGTSHPIRSAGDYWSELWIVVYSPPWAVSGPMGTNTPVDCGIGQLVPRRDVDAIKGLLETWKSAGAYVRAIVWCYDATLFDPSSPLTMPDGTWGDWAFNGSLSGRGLKEQANKIRTWEPERDPNVGGPWA